MNNTILLAIACGLIFFTLLAIMVIAVVMTLKWSYDLRVSVKVEGCDKYSDIGYPEYDHPTYNLRDMFEACMNWDYSQGEYYPCAEYVSKIERGITELKFHRENYVKYNPSNGWGSIDSALKALESWWECIQEKAETIPIDCLYIRW